MDRFAKALQVLEDIEYIGEDDLCNADDLEQLLPLCQLCPNLEKLDCRGKRVVGRVMEIAMRILVESKTIRRVSFAERGDMENLELFAEGLQNNSSVMRVKFACTSFHGIDTLSSVVRARPDINLVKVSGPEGLLNPRNVLWKLMATPSCVRTLSGSRMTISSPIRIDPCSLIQQISFTYCRWGEDAVVQLCNGLQRCHALKSLRISWSPLSLIEVTAVAHLMCYRKTLTAVNLKATCIDDEGGRALGEAIKYNRSLRTLDLSWNNIGHAGARYVWDGLINNISMDAIHIACNRISPFSAYEFCDQVSKNKARRAVVAEETTQWLLINNKLELVHKGVDQMICARIATHLK